MNFEFPVKSQLAHGSRLIKEYCESSSTVVVTSDTYNSSLDYIMYLVKIAYMDFPELKLSDIVVKKYGGDRRKGFVGIEFKSTNAPKNYYRVSSLEYTF